MEPDVVRLYSSSPPPLDEGEEEEGEDEFGDFGGYCSGVSSSFSFSEFDTPTSASQSHAAETSPPDLHATSVQNVSSSGKNVTSEEAEKLTETLQASLSISNPLVNETSVSIDDCENGKAEVSEIVSNGVPPSDSLKEAPSVVSNTFQHRSATNLKPEASSAVRQSDLSIDGGGRCLSNGQSKLNTGTAPDGSTVTSLTNSTDTGLVSREKSSSGPLPVPPIAEFQIVQEGVSGCGGNVVDEVSTEFQDISSNNTSGDQSIIDEGREEQEEQQEQKEVSTILQEPSGEENVASFGDVVPESGSEDFGDWTETSVGLAAEADEVSGAELCKDSVDHTTVPGMEMREGFQEVCGTTTNFTVEAVPDAEGGSREVLRELKGTMEMDESFGDFRDAVGVVDFSQTESATQEGFADFVTALGCSTDDDFGETDTLKDWKEEEELPEEDQEEASDKNTAGTWCSELPPSDSFADFSSAPFGGLASGSGDSWAAFGVQEECGNQRESWSAFGEKQPSGTAVATPGDGLQNDDVSVGRNCKLQNLFQSSFFPSEVTSEVKDVVPLQALLDPQDNQENSSHPVLGEAAAMWHHLLDTHSAHGLKVQWVGSHSNRILLDCLGIRNILFTGQKKRPLIVPMFASGLGMLEPTKDPVRPSPTSPAPQTPYSPGQGRSTLCTLQVASSLSSKEDAGGVVSQLNLDFFGPVDDSSSDSDTDTPVPPGVDPELYELTTAKLDSSNVGTNNVAEAFNKLMETVEKTSTVTRKTEKDGAISEEAARVISLLPDMSFMRARVLMFPYSLNPAANCP